jgi:hypothetical protein
LKAKTTATQKRLCGKQMSMVGAVGFEKTTKRSFNNMQVSG